MSDPNYPHGLKPYVPQPKAAPEPVTEAHAAPLRRDPVSGLGYYEDSIAQPAASTEQPSLLARAQQAFSRWFKGEDQIPVPRPQPMHHEKEPLRWVDGREYHPQPVPQKPSVPLQRYEDVLAQQKLACADVNGACAPQAPHLAAADRTVTR